MSQKTPLFDEHVAAGGKMVDFAGYSLPVHYGSLVSEHHAVRQSAGMFDVSHMTIVDITGEGAAQWLRYLLTNDINKLVKGGALYSCMCNEDAGVIDDLIAYYLDDASYRLIVNAATREKDLAWMKQHQAADVQLDVVEDLALIAVQGPQAVDIAAKELGNVGLDLDAVSTLKRFSACKQGKWFIARTGYTGEDGLEIALPADQAVDFWRALAAAGVQAAGLGARDTLRLEAGMSLYGNDLDESHTPVESGIAWTVDLKDPDRHFIGRKVLVEQKASGGRFVQVGLTLEGRGVLRQGQTVELNGIEVGSITSGTFSPTLEKSIALARVSRPIEGGCEVRIRDKSHAARVISVPFLA